MMSRTKPRLTLRNSARRQTTNQRPGSLGLNPPHTIHEIPLSLYAATCRCGCWTIEYQVESVSEVYSKHSHVRISCGSCVVFVSLELLTEGAQNCLLSPKK